MSTTTEDAINDQISDSILQIQKSISGNAAEFSAAVTQQLTAQAVSLAMQNAVAQQQEQYILRNAIVTAAAKAIIESNPSDAIVLAEKVLSGNDIAATLNELKPLMPNPQTTEPISKPKTAKKTTRQD